MAPDVRVRTESCYTQYLFSFDSAANRLATLAR
jgi:hypothetical protein